MTAGQSNQLSCHHKKPVFWNDKSARIFLESYTPFILRKICEINHFEILLQGIFEYSARVECFFKMYLFSECQIVTPWCFSGWLPWSPACPPSLLGIRLMETCLGSLRRLFSSSGWMRSMALFMSWCYYQGNQNKELAMMLHPDKKPDTEEFKQLAAVYNVLKDKKGRAN